MLLDDDIVVDPHFLHPILSHFKDPQLFAIAPRVSWPDSSSSATPMGKARAEIRQGRLRLWQDPWSDGETEADPVLWVPRGRAAYLRTRFLQLGGFDPLFSHDGIGDVDLGFRAWKLGWRLLAEPTSVLHRLASPQPEQPPPALDAQQGERLLFLWKNLDSLQSLVNSQLSLALALLDQASKRQLNLRPLRLALVQLPRVLRRHASHNGKMALSDEEVFRLSSHRYFLRQSRRALQPATTCESLPGESRAAGHLTSNGLPAADSPLRILMVCPQLPYPPYHGSAVRMWNLVRTLAERNEVDILSLSEPSLDPAEVAASVDQLKRCCRTVLTVPRRPVSTTPSLADRTIHVEMFDCPELRKTLLDLLDSNSYDVIQFDKTELGQYALPGPAPVQVLVEHIIFYHAYRRQFLKWSRSLPTVFADYLKLRRYEIDACRRFDGVITMSPVDTRFLRGIMPDHPCIVDIANGVDTDYYRYSPLPTRSKDLLFVGNFDHSPNVDAVKFFIREVFPEVKAAEPQGRLLIVGPGPYNTLPEVSSDPAILPVGLVEDTRPYMERCAVFVAPILAGSGTRLKVLEAMAAGIPIVSTTVGAEGLEVTSGVHLLLANQAEAFAEKVITLLREPGLGNQLKENARQLVEARYDWRTIAGRLEQLYRRLVASKQLAPAPRVRARDFT